MKKRLIYSFLIFSILVSLAVVQPTRLRYFLLSTLTSLESPFIYYTLGDYCAKGLGIKPDLKQAEFWYLKAAKHNYPRAMYKLGHLYSHRHGIQKGREKEKSFWDDMPLDYHKAIKWYTYAADLEYISAYVRLGYIHRQGIDVPIDYKQSFSWYRKAAKAGNKKGQAWLGYFYSHGLERESLCKNLLNCWNGIKTDYQKALKWYLRAAFQGVDTAQYMVGFFYSHGAINSYSKTQTFDHVLLEIPGVPLDYNKAVEWFTKAAQQGHKIAHRKIGFLYVHGGYGLEKNLYQAFNWYMAGADKGDAVCMRKVAYCYDDGIGTRPNMERAIEWYTKAVEHGDAFAQELLDSRRAQQKAAFFYNSRP